MSSTFSRLALAVGMALSAVTSADIDPDTAEGVMAINRKIQCSTVDGKAQTYVWYGEVWSRRQGEADRHLFDAVGTNVRACGSVTAPNGKPGYRMVSREIMVYTDPASGEIIDEWDNPFTGETVEVIHVNNDPVNSWAPSTGYDRDGSVSDLGLRRVGPRWQRVSTIPLFYHNPMGGDYQKYVGGSYHATEMFNFSGEWAPLVDEATDEVYPNISWVRISDWLPWMEMNGREGILYFNAQGAKLRSRDELPDVLKTVIAERFPTYDTPPPLDDRRRNATTWTVVKDMIDERRAQQGAQDSTSGH